MTMDDFKNKTSGAFNSGGGFNGNQAKKAGRILIITVLIGAALVILSGSFYTIRELRCDVITAQQNVPSIRKYDRHVGVFCGHIKRGNSVGKRLPVDRNARQLPLVCRSGGHGDHFGSGKHRIW